MVKTKQVNKSAETGRFVPNKTVEQKPKETYRQTVPVHKPAPKKK